MNQLNTGGSSSAGCQQIVDQQDTGSIRKSIGLDFKTIAAVFKGVINTGHFAGKFSGFSDRHKANLLLCGQRRAHDEAPGLNSHDQVWLESLADVAKLLDHFLLARRLVEVGVRCVSLSFSRWDWHGGNFNRARQDFPMLDQGLTALVEDLQQRGMDKDVVVVCWGEFGRTPTINKDAGRDHWPRVSCGLLACGGLRHGQVIGATDRLGGEASERPVTFAEVHSTLYHALGIDPNATTVNDLNGRPRYLVENNAQPLHEVI
mgnify:CR=1 FL=1